MSVDATQLLMTLGSSALALAPSLIEAIRTGNGREARDVAEEMARREAFDARQKAKEKKRG